MIAIKETETDSKHCTSQDFFNKIPLFSGLSADEITSFAEATNVKNYTKGQMLYLEGDTAHFFHIICTGWLKLFHTTEDGEDVMIAMLTKHSITGESAIFEHGCYAYNAQIVEPARILSIPLDLLKQQLSRNNKLAFNMLSSMMQYQRLHEQQLEQYLLYSTPQRVGCFLLGLCPISQQKDGVQIDLPYDKSLIASTLGMKGPTFSRALNILRDETGIHISGTHVTIGSIDRLLNFVNGCYSYSRTQMMIKEQER